MTALGKLFGATAFRLALAILVLSAVGSGVVLYIIAWQVESVVDKEIARTVDAEAKGLIDTFDNAGIRRLYAVIEARKREPGASLYLLTNPIGEPLAGNVEQIPSEVLLHPGFVPIIYRGTGSSERGREALVGVYILPGGFRLLDRARPQRPGSHRQGHGARAGDLIGVLRRARGGGRPVRRPPRAQAHR